MNQKKKNVRLLVYLTTLIVITVMVYFSGSERSGVSFDKYKFRLGENIVITDVELQGQNFTNHLEYNNGVWMVNGKYFVDQGMRDVFFAVLSQVEVHRPASESIIDSLTSTFSESGIKVTITNNGEAVKQYYVVGDRERYSTWFLAEGEDLPHKMRIPGYHSYIAGIYQVGENDWRERFIWTMEWSRLKKFEVTYVKGDKDDLVFEYVDNFIKVGNLDDMDTTQVMEYLQFAANLQVESFISEKDRFRYDSLLTEELHYATINFEEIGNRQNSLILYNRELENNLIPGILNEDQVILLHRDNVELLYKEAKDFRKR